MIYHINFKTIFFIHKKLIFFPMGCIFETDLGQIV